MRYHVSLIPILAALAHAQKSLPTTIQGLNAAQLSSLSALGIPYDTSLLQQPAYTTFSQYMATATGVTPDEATAFAAAHNNPISLAIEYLAATVTPVWYTQLPGDLQSYVSSVANAQASILTQALSGADRVGDRVAVMGALLTAAVVGVLML